jgi:hypothetical protein
MQQGFGQVQRHDTAEPEITIQQEPGTDPPALEGAEAKLFSPQFRRRELPKKESTPGESASAFLS